MGLEFNASTADEAPPVTPARPLPRTNDDNDDCFTPTTNEQVLSNPTKCPPAPRKARPAKRKLAAGAAAAPQKVSLFAAVPRDLTSVFLAINARPLEKRIRVS